MTGRRSLALLSIAVLAVAGAFAGRLLRRTPSVSPSPAQTQPVEARKDLSSSAGRSTPVPRPRESSASTPEASPRISEEQARKLAQGYRRAAISNLHGSEPKPSEISSCTLKDGQPGQRVWVALFEDRTVLRLDAANGLLERFTLGRVERGSLCTESGRCDGKGPVCRAEGSKLTLELTRKRADEFIAATNPPAALGPCGAKRESDYSPHHSRDSFSWTKEKAHTLTVEVEPYTGDVVDFDIRHAVPETPVSVTREAATVIAVDALRKRYPEHFSGDAIVSTETIMTNLPLSSDGRGPESPVWYVAVRVKCRCREPVHEKILDQLVHPVTGQPIDWATGKSPR